jgi:hypothetical protein
MTLSFSRKYIKLSKSTWISASLAACEVGGALGDIPKVELGYQ